ncbi:MAG TPA: hypothetical protein VFN94_01400 [Nitrospiria bacterium]|nr:hypothetical protein [Nitrospiria bacterium]
MRSTWPSLALAALMAACPIAVHAADDTEDSTRPPQHLVVDSDSAPKVSVTNAVQLVEIVLVPSGEYRPVHPDSVEPDGEPASVEPDAAPAK